MDIGYDDETTFTYYATDSEGIHRFDWEPQRDAWVARNPRDRKKLAVEPNWTPGELNVINHY